MAALRVPLPVGRRAPLLALLLLCLAPRAARGVQSDARGAVSSAIPQKLLNEIDAFVEPIDHRHVGGTVCSDMVARLVASVKTDHQNQKLRHRRIMHTGDFLQSDGGTDAWREGERKLRLGVLSFLSSQDPNDTQLQFWSDDVDHPVLHAALHPILADGRFAERILIRKFDPGHEFTKATAPNAQAGEALLTLYRLDHILASKSDLLRMVVLHNYGGVWMDTDVLLVSDIAPLVGEDWAYLGQPDFINNAVLSVSKPGSPFIKAYLQAVVTSAARLSGKEGTGNRGVASAARLIRKEGTGNGIGHGIQVLAFGPFTLHSLHSDAQNKSTFHILPTCFFDGGWSGEKSATRWDDFFTKPASEEQIRYVAPGGKEEHRAFGYHWHGRWEQPIARGSLADAAEARYLEKLDIKL